MITGELKSVKEIVPTIAGYKHLLVVGCGGCVSVCLTGGDREARTLAAELSRTRHYPENPPTFEVQTIERQCETDWLETYFEIPAGVDAVLSLACGAGVQTMAAVYDPLPVIPALNTTFLGANIEQGVFQEMCRGCGDCVLAYTGGICPVARCAKGLYNGPCGGTNNGSCEIRTDVPCAWAMIFYRLKRQNKLHLMTEVRTPPDWRPGGGAGPRELRAHIKEP
jgi:ferredoxin